MRRVHYGDGNPSYAMLLIWLLWWFHGAMLSLPSSKRHVARGRFFSLLGRQTTLREADVTGLVVWNPCVCHLTWLRFNRDLIAIHCPYCSWICQSRCKIQLTMVHRWDQERLRKAIYSFRPTTNRV